MVGALSDNKDKNIINIIGAKYQLNSDFMSYIVSLKRPFADHGINLLALI